MKTKMKLSRREIIIILTAVVIGLIIGRLWFHSPRIVTDKEDQLMTKTEVKQPTIWTCSMHPQIRLDHPGKCPICSMDLISLEDYVTEDTTESIDEIQMTDAAIKLADIVTARVERSYPENKIYLLGKVRPDESRIAELTARFGGRIEKMFVSFTGEKVEKGERLVTIYSPELVLAQKELLEILAYKGKSSDLYHAVRNKLKLWNLTDEQIDNIEKGGVTNNYFDVLSPIEGTVTRRDIAVGDYVKEGSALFQVVDLSKVWVMFEGYERDLPWIKKGDDVSFTIKSMPGKNYKGKVSFIDPVIDPKTRIANVRVEVMNKSGSLKPEMFANGIVTSSVAGSNKDLVVPKTAVLWTGKRSVVYVKVPDREQPTFLFREIVLGPEAGDYYVVAEGLQEGEEIAVNGVFKIDASAQLAGKKSMMNPKGGKGESSNNYESMDMNMKMDDSTKNKDNIEHAEFKVYGNCGMCKERIENAALELPGVRKAEWNQETKMFMVMFDKSLTKLEDIHKAIASAGHDTDKETAPDDIYNELPECCLYRE